MELPDYRLRGKNPAPAAIAKTQHVEVRDGHVVGVTRTLLEQLPPYDELRLCRVRSDPAVLRALEALREIGRQIEALQPRLVDDPDAIAKHASLVRAEGALRDQLLGPAVERAEARLEQLLRIVAPRADELVSCVSDAVDADQLLAMAELLRRNPHWGERELWVRPDTRTYLAAALMSETKFVRLRAMKADAKPRHVDFRAVKWSVRPFMV